jgi:hypothetical protein
MLRRRGMREFLLTRTLEPALVLTSLVNGITFRHLRPLVVGALVIGVVHETVLAVTDPTGEFSVAGLVLGAFAALGWSFVVHWLVVFVSSRGY